MRLRHSFILTIILSSTEREAEILKPLSSVEVVEKEEANFDCEISEDDVPGEWKLQGRVLQRSPVRFHCQFYGFSNVVYNVPLNVLQPYILFFFNQDM